jgi:hypothetical protein
LPAQSGAKPGLRGGGHLNRFEFGGPLRHTAAVRVRIGMVRVLIGALWVGLLVVPVGIDVDGQLRVARSIGESLRELASGRLGVGILSGLVAGGELAAQAGVRIALAALAAVAFWLTGRMRPVETSQPDRPPRRRCPSCGKWASTAMADCPSCGRPLVSVG